MLTPFEVRVLSIVLLASTLGASTARAQFDNRLAVGGSVTGRLSNSSAADGGLDVGFEIRMGHEHDGFGSQLSFFGWFESDVRDDSTTTQAGTIGSLRIRPIMAGCGYTKTHGRVAVTADVLGGFSFNSFHLNSIAEAYYRATLGAQNIRTEATNGFVIKPEVQMWYDVSHRIGVKLSGGYLVTRPSVSIISSLGKSTRSIKSDAFLLSVVVVYSIF